jgi:hypothetical protein
MPVNRAAQEGQLAWFEPEAPCPCGQKFRGLHPIYAGAAKALSQPKSVGTGSLGQDLMLTDC